MRSAIALAATLTLSALVAAQSATPQSSPERPRFDAASVKPNRSPSAGMNNSFSPGRFAYVNTPLASLIYMAYGFQSERVLDMPDWARAEKFDVTATHSPEYDSFSPQQRAMLQRLLEERFALRLHRETREMPVYELVRVRLDGPLGPRLRESTVDCSTPATARSAECGVRITGTLIDGKAVQWRIVPTQLASAAGRTVIDKTGLEGRFEMRLEWRPDPSLMQSPEAVAMATAAAAAAPGDAVPIFTAVQEQLGLKLQSARAPLEVLVIDRLERPTPD